MDNDKRVTVTTTTGSDGIGALVDIVDNHSNPVIISPTLSSTRTYSSPLMGTSARAAKRRIDGDTGAIRLEGTDTYNQQLQHHYQNVRQILEDQQPNQISNIDQSNESGQTFNSRRDFFEQRFKSPTYDSPPREQRPAQKIITTITTTTTTKPTARNQTNASLNQSSSTVDLLLEQAAELQKLTTVDSTPKNDSPEPLVIERTEQYQVFVDPKNHEMRRTPTIPITKTSHVTDLDPTHSQVDRSMDDHQAIQKLTRALQDHNTTTINEYKRLPSQTNPVLINTTTTTTTTTLPSNMVLTDRTNRPITSEFTVIDALLDNPLGTNNNKQNNTLHTRFSDILSNLRNSEYVKVLRQSTARITKKSARGSRQTSLVDKQTRITELIMDPTVNFSDQTLLAGSKKSKKWNKRKSKQLSKNTDYHVIDALISSPISLRLPDSYLTKYRVTPPLSQLSLTNIPFPQQLDTKVTNETVYNLVKIVNELMLHHAAVVTTSFNTTTNQLQKSIKPIYSTPINQPRSISTPYQSSEPIKPRIIYRYKDEQGHILKISSTSPSQLREIIPEEFHQDSYKKTKPTYSNSRPISLDDERRHFISEDEQRNIWQDESKLPTTITRDNSESRDKRISKLTEQPVPTIRTIPISLEREHSIKTPFQQPPQHMSHPPNQQNVQLAWLPLSYQLDQKHIPGGGTAGYDTDSTTSERSITYRPYDYVPPDNHHRYNNRPLFQNTYNHNRSPLRPNHPSPLRSPYGQRGISPDYGVSRNYIEVFRDGEIKPSEVYSLPFNQSPTTTTSQRPSRYDQYQSEKYGKNLGLSSSPTRKYTKIIPSLSTHDPYSPHTLENSPNRDPIYFDNYLRQSKSSDYRPLRNKLQREYKITPSLLVDEWEHPPQSTSTSFTKQTSVSSPDDVFLNNHRTNKA